MMKNSTPIINMQFDIVIAGGSLSAPAAALSCARMNPNARILLTESTDWLGGQATSQGVSAIDNCWFEPGCSLMRDNGNIYYPKDYLEWLDRLWHKPIDAPGEGMAPYLAGWVSREAFDPRTAAWILEKMILEFPNITYMPLTVVKSCETQSTPDRFGDNGKLISAICLIKRAPVNGYIPHSDLLSQEMPDWYETSDSHRFTKTIVHVTPIKHTLVVIDATEAGEVIVLSEADYTVGREIDSDDSLLTPQLPEIDENGSQATVFPFCMTFGDEEDTDFDKTMSLFYPNFDRDYERRLHSYFSFGNSNWKVVWTYRRIYCTGSVGMEDVHRDDVSMQNWYPGNDYPDASIYMNKKQAQNELSDWKGGWHYHHIADAENIAFAWYRFLRDSNPMPWPTCFARDVHPKNMMGTKHGLSKFPYIRCGRRIIGLDYFRLSSKYLVNLETPVHHDTSFRFFDSIGIGDYAVDVHPITSSKGVLPPFERAAPFYIPLRSLASVNVRNLLAGGKNTATTYITNAAYRLHPIEWQAGSSVGVLAAFMHDQNCSAYDILYSDLLKAVQYAVSLNAPIHWSKYDKDIIPDTNGDFLLNTNIPTESNQTFDCEVYFPGTYYAEIYADNIKIAEGTTIFANQTSLGTVKLQNLKTQLTPNVYAAKCYDNQNKLIGILTRDNRYSHIQ